VLFFFGIAVGLVILHLVLSALLQLRKSNSAMNERLREVGRLRSRLNKKVLAHDH
jgi:hypothetical protein